MANTTTKTTAQPKPSAAPTKVKTEAQKEWDKRECGALWSKTSPTSGNTYLSGKMTVDVFGAQKVLHFKVFPNRFFEEGSNLPMYRIYLDQDTPSTQPKKVANKTVAAPVEQQEEENDDGVL